MTAKLLCCCHGLDAVRFGDPSNAVDAFRAAAMKAGGGDDGAPGTGVDHSPTDEAAFVIDADNHNLEVVFVE